MSKDLLLVAISLFAWGMGESAYRFFQPLYLEELGATPMAIGTILGGVGIAMTIAHIPAGYLADRIGRRVMMWAAWTLGVISGILMASAQTLPVFTTGVLLYGVTAFVVAPMNSYITAARGNWSVGRAITFTSAMYNLGAIFGPFLGGIIGDHFGYARIYMFATVIFLISSGFIFQIKPQPTVTTSEASVSRNIFSPRFLCFLPILFLANLGMYISQPLAPNFLQNAHDLNLSQIGSLGAISSVGSVVIMVTLGSMNAGIGFILGQLATGLYSLLLWGGNGFPWFAVGFFMLGGFRSARAMSIAYIRDLISTAKMGLGYGVVETIGGGGVILASIWAGVLYGRDPSSIFIVAIVLTIMSILATIVFIKFPKNR